MTERIDVVNLALTWLGEDVVTSLEDDLDRARIMKVNYLPARDATLEAHDWSFAILRFEPPLNATPPVYGAGQAFDVPPEILRIISVSLPDTNANAAFVSPIDSLPQIDWLFERGQVICNEEVIFCRGSQRVDEEGRFSPLFVHAFAAKLAYLCAVALTASLDSQANMLALYSEFILEAKSRDGLQGRSRRLRQRTLSQVR